MESLYVIGTLSTYFERLQSARLHRWRYSRSIFSDLQNTEWELYLHIMFLSWFSFVSIAQNRQNSELTDILYKFHCIPISSVTIIILWLFDWNYNIIETFKKIKVAYKKYFNNNRNLIRRNIVCKLQKLY